MWRGGALVGYLERLLDLFIDLMAQLPTRRFFHAVLCDSHVLTRASISAFLAATHLFHSSSTPCFSAARCESCALRMASSSSSKRLLYFLRFFAISASFSSPNSEGARGRHRNW